MKKIKTLIITTLMLSSFSVFAESSGQPVYECSPEELKNSIQAYTVALRSPSPLPQAAQVQTDIIEQKLDENEDEEDGACAGLFSGDRPSFDFKGLMDGLSMPSFSLDSIKQKMTMEALNQLRKQLSEAFCELVSGSAETALSQSLNEIRGQYGVDFDNLGGSFDYLVDDALYDKYGNNAKYFRDPERFGDDQRYEADQDVRNKVRDLWN